MRMSSRPSHTVWAMISQHGGIKRTAGRNVLLKPCHGLNKSSTVRFITTAGIIAEGQVLVVATLGLGG